MRSGLPPAPTVRKPELPASALLKSTVRCGAAALRSSAHAGGVAASARAVRTAPVFGELRMVPNATPRTHDGLQPINNLRELLAKASPKSRPRSAQAWQHPVSWAANALELN